MWVLTVDKNDGQLELINVASISYSEESKEMVIYCVDTSNFILEGVSKQDYIRYIRRIYSDGKIDLSTTSYKGYWDNND